MTTVIIDYESGNLRSAEKSFQRMSAEVDGGPILVTNDPEDVRRADRIVLPGVGAFADCRAGLDAIPGKQDLARQAAKTNFKPISKHQAEMESRILYCYEVDDSCECDDDICRL